ncbi:Mg-chelatase subunit ChlD [Paenibacillus sp. DS2015]|uniref:VWA domain-containing protein n=1 Tax=Paenibacillus sp. DS2015 TaxID=3373917 RepID=UPI003D1DABAB
MICTHCGQDNEENSKFCVHCGNSMIEQDSPNNQQPLVQETEELPVAVVTESVPLTQEEEIHTITAKRPLNKWLFIGLASVLLISAVIVIFTVQLSTKAIPLSENSVAANVDTPTTADADSVTHEIQPIKISTITNNDYPVIELVLEAKNIESLDLSLQNFTVTENGVSQTVSLVEPSGSSQLTVSYETNVVNVNHNKAEPRNIELHYLDQTTTAHYDAPQPQMLTIGDVSYNTDQYPQVKLFFSLYDSNQQLVEDISTQPSFLQVKEGNQALQSLDLAKMSEVKESLSTNVVIDVSTSMDGIMELVKSQAIQFVNQSDISGNDQMALMSFAGATEISQNKFTNNKNAITSEISQLDSYGQCTALYRSLEQALYNIAYNDANGSKYVVIFTDGGENCSNDISNQSAVSAGTVINTSLQLGVPIYAVGIDHDDELQRIARESNGDYISIGSDIDRLGEFYNSIYTKKKAQYVATYTSANPKKAARTAGIFVNSPKYYLEHKLPVTPRLLDDPAVATAMEMYQINWSNAMSSGDMSYLSPYVTVNSSSPTSVYKVVLNQVNSINEARVSGSYFEFDVPIYKLEDATKVAEDEYQLKVKKRFKRTVWENGSVESIAFKETAYTYNLISQNNTWLVDSTVESTVPDICYVDDTYATKKKCN